MGEVLGKVIEELIALFKKNYKRPKLWLSVLAVGFILILLLPYIDSNFFYFSRMDKRIEILEKVMALDRNLIETNQVYLNEYQNILYEMEQQDERSINSLMNKLIYSIDFLTEIKSAGGNKAVQFVTGALWFIILTICIPFMNAFNKKADKILAFLCMAFLSLIVGGISCMIPIVIMPIVNYIGVPLLQLILISMFIIKNNKKKEKNRQ